MTYQARMVDSLDERRKALEVLPTTPLTRKARTESRIMHSAPPPKRRRQPRNHRNVTPK
jgi:hypothetical protein